MRKLRNILALTIAICLVCMCGCNNKSSNDVTQKDEAVNKLSDEEIEDIFQRMKNGESNGSNNIFDLLQPTHAQAADYPYDYIYDGWGEDVQDKLKEIGDFYWTPNKPIMIDENIDYIEFRKVKYDSFDEFKQKHVTVDSNIEVVLDAEAAGFSDYSKFTYIGDNFSFPSGKSETMSIEDLIKNNIWRYFDLPWKTQWWYENGDCAKYDCSSEDYWDVLEHLIKDWGMPSEVYIRPNESSGRLTTHLATLIWDCDGYDAVYEIKKATLGFEIGRVCMYGDGWKEFTGQLYLGEAEEDYIKLD